MRFGYWIFNFFSAALILTIFLNVQSLRANEEQVQNIINQSIASYPGVCACPYSTASNGSKCGRRSAYSKPGGYDPLCYPEDVYQLYPELRQTTKNKTTQNERWFCPSDQESFAVQFYEGKMEVISSSKAKASIKKNLGSAGEQSVDASEGTVFEITPQSTIKLYPKYKVGQRPSELLENMAAALGQLDWKVTEEGIFGTGTVMIQLTPEFNALASFAQTMDYEGNMHSSITSFMAGKPFSIFSEGKCETF